jgi:hypothetical protein
MENFLVKLEDIDISGNKTKKYSALVVGIEATTTQIIGNGDGC